jgi:hypothetical protein
MWWRSILILSSQVCLPMPFRWSWDILFKSLDIHTFVIFFMHAACLNCLIRTDLTMDFLWCIILSVLQHHVHNFFVRLRDQVTNWWPCHAMCQSVSWHPVTLGLSSIAASQCGICGGQSGTQISVSPSASVSPFVLFHPCTILIYVSPMLYNHNIWQNC